MDRFARAVSILLHPFVVTAVLVAVPAARLQDGGAGRAVLTVGGAVILPLLILMVRQVRRGRWTNIDASNRSERPILFVASIAVMGLLLAWLLANDPRSFLIRGIIVCGLFVIVAALLTRWIKLSLHVGFVATTATTLSIIGSLAGYALIPAIPLVAWSRMRMARHTLPEVLTGLALGLAAGVALAWA